jgi:hypothetical protein
MQTASPHIVRHVFTHMLHAAVDIHKGVDDDTPITSAAFAVLGDLLPLLPQVSMCATDGMVSSSRILLFEGCLEIVTTVKNAHDVATLQILMCAQSRLTFQWDLRDDRRLRSLDATEQATCSFLQCAAPALATSYAHSLRQAGFSPNHCAACLVSQQWVGSGPCRSSGLTGHAAVDCVACASHQQPPAARSARPSFVQGDRFRDQPQQCPGAKTHG